MSCYFRHMKNILDEAGIEATPGNKKEIDQAFHHIVDVNYKDCPSAWKKPKQEWTTDEQKRQELIPETTKYHPMIQKQLFLYPMTD